MSQVLPSQILGWFCDDINCPKFSFSDRIRLVDFLIRRVDGKQLIIYSLKQVIEEKELLGSVAQIFDMINDVLAIYHAERMYVILGIQTANNRKS